MRSEFASSTENVALKQAIIDAIRARGGISFRDFMAMALYERGLGYYESPREKMGREGDYLTSPEVSPLFGAMIGRHLRELWEAMRRPPRFQVVEAGAGTGRLCADVLGWAERAAPAFAASLEYTVVEVSAAMAGRQRRLLAAEGRAGRVRWEERLPEGSEGCILSNELLDAMPVHRANVQDGVLREVYVGWDGTAFVEELREPGPEIGEYFRRLGLLPGDGCFAEVNLEAMRWMREAAGALRRGFLLTLDYGHEAAELFAPWRRDGTLLCFYRHNPSTDAYARIGRQDMTSHLDLTSLRRAGEESGLETLANVSQAEFLERMGIGEALSREGGLEEYYARRRAVMELMDPAGLGRIRVLIQSKGVPAAKLTLAGAPGSA